MAKKRPWDERWEIVGPLGAGGQGTTQLVRARDGSVERAVLKELRNRKSAQARGRMRREVVSLNVLARTGGRVPKVLDDNTDEFENADVPLYFVMEYVAGRTLASAVESNGPFSVDESLAIALDICETVALAHSEGVLHRDMKPDNTILTDGGDRRVYIVDYGLSFNQEEERDETQTGEPFRNNFLTLPEAVTLGGNRREPRSDLAAVCGLLYFCLTGHAPQQLIDDQGRPPHRRPGCMVRERHAGDPRLDHLEALFDRGFSNAIEARFATVDELIERIRAVVNASDPLAAEDLGDLFARASDFLLRYDRKTQLGTFRQPAQRIFKALAHHLDGVKSRGRFGIANHDALIGGKFPIPSEFDQVPGQFCCQLSAEHNENVRAILYRVGAAGTEGALMRCTVKRETAQETPAVASDWEVVFHFQSDIEPNAALAIADLDRQIAKAVRELTHLITGYTP